MRIKKLVLFLLLNWLLILGLVEMKGLKTFGASNNTIIQTKKTDCTHPGGGYHDFRCSNTTPGCYYLCERNLYGDYNWKLNCCDSKKVCNCLPGKICHVTYDTPACVEEEKCKCKVGSKEYEAGGCWCDIDSKGDHIRCCERKAILNDCHEIYKEKCDLSAKMKCTYDKDNKPHCTDASCNVQENPNEYCDNVCNKSGHPKGKCEEKKEECVDVYDPVTGCCCYSKELCWAQDDPIGFCNSQCKSNGYASGECTKESNCSGDYDYTNDCCCYNMPPPLPKDCKKVWEETGLDAALSFCHKLCRKEGYYCGYCGPTSCSEGQTRLDNSCCCYGSKVSGPLGPDCYDSTDTSFCKNYCNSNGYIHAQCSCDCSIGFPSQHFDNLCCCWGKAATPECKDNSECQIYCTNIDVYTGGACYKNEEKCKQDSGDHEPNGCCCFQ